MRWVSEPTNWTFASKLPKIAGTKLDRVLIIFWTQLDFLNQESITKMGQLNKWTLDPHYKTCWKSLCMWKQSLKVSPFHSNSLETLILPKVAKKYSVRALYDDSYEINTFIEFVVKNKYPQDMSSDEMD